MEYTSLTSGWNPIQRAVQLLFRGSSDRDIEWLKSEWYFPNVEFKR